MRLIFNGTGIRISEVMKKAIANKKSAFINRRNILKAANLALLPALSIIAFTGLVRADDLLAGGKEAVTDTFGKDSSLAGWIVLGEVIVGVIGYITTKNIKFLFGIPVVIVFTSIGFGLAA